MAKIESYKDLIAWQKAMELVVAVYELTAKYPPAERFGLTSQSRHAVVGIPSNIAEGYGRRTRADYMHFLDIARGSANELETQLLIGIRVGFVTGAGPDARWTLSSKFNGPSEACWKDWIGRQGRDSGSRRRAPLRLRPMT